MYLVLQVFGELVETEERFVSIHEIKWYAIAARRRSYSYHSVFLFYYTSRAKPPNITVLPINIR